MIQWHIQRVHSRINKGMNVMLITAEKEDLVLLSM